MRGPVASGQSSVTCDTSGHRLEDLIGRTGSRLCVHLHRRHFLGHRMHATMHDGEPARPQTATRVAPNADADERRALREHGSRPASGLRPGHIGERRRIRRPARAQQPRFCGEGQFVPDPAGREDQDRPVPEIKRVRDLARSTGTARARAAIPRRPPGAIVPAGHGDHGAKDRDHATSVTREHGGLVESEPAATRITAIPVQLNSDAERAAESAAAMARQRRGGHRPPVPRRAGKARNRPRWRWWR